MGVDMSVARDVAVQEDQIIQRRHRGPHPDPPELEGKSGLVAVDLPLSREVAALGEERARLRRRVGRDTGVSAAESRDVECRKEPTAAHHRDRDDRQDGQEDGAGQDLDVPR